MNIFKTNKIRCLQIFPKDIFFSLRIWLIPLKINCHNNQSQFNKYIDECKWYCLQLEKQQHVVHSTPHFGEERLNTKAIKKCISRTQQPSDGHPPPHTHTK